jgi:hypothetical protein
VILDQIKDSLNTVFQNDYQGFEKYTDPDDDWKDIPSAVDGIYEKIMDYQKVADCEFVPFEDGYVFYQLSPRRLVSFGIRPSKRTSRGLKELWNHIISCIGTDFDCLLWSKNTRAIRWLQHSGMTIARTLQYDNNEITHLKICQYQQ